MQSPEVHYLRREGISGLVSEDAGEHDLNGVLDRWRLHVVVGS